MPAVDLAPATSRDRMRGQRSECHFPSWFCSSPPFCQIFFEDVEVPRDRLVGPLNGGRTNAADKKFQAGFFVSGKRHDIE